jgi:hypothetical protein
MSESRRLDETLRANLFVSASLKILQQPQQVIRYRFPRDFVEDRTHMAANVSLQGRGETVIQLDPGGVAGHVGAAVLDCMVHFFAYAWHFAPAVLLVRFAVHDRSPVALNR